MISWAGTSPIQEEEEEKLQRLFPLPLLAADFFLAPPEPEVAQGLHLEGVAGVVFQPRQAVLGQKALEKEIVLELLARIQKEGATMLRSRKPSRRVP